MPNLQKLDGIDARRTEAFDRVHEQLEGVHGKLKNSSGQDTGPMIFAEDLLRENQTYVWLIQKGAVVQFDLLGKETLSELENVDGIYVAEVDANNKLEKIANIEGHRKKVGATFNRAA